VNTAAASAPWASKNGLGPIRRNDGVVLEWGRDYDAINLKRISAEGVEEGIRDTIGNTI
jgi:hypothetical protein